jgi:outer membrane protein OmpA-like peptidoglycan-associated protein
MKWLRRIGWVAAGVLGLWAVAWLAVPPLLKSQAQQKLGAMLGREVTFGEVSFSPWSMELTVRDIAIAAASDAAAGTVPPLLKIARVHVNAEMASLWHLAPVVEALEIDAPEIHLTHLTPGHYDIDDILARLADMPKSEPSGEPVHFAVYNIKVSNGSFSFDDKPMDRRHELKSLNLGLPFVSNIPAHVSVQVEPRLAFVFNGTAFDTGAQARPFASTREAKVQFKMDALDLAPYAVYLPDSLPVRLVSGTTASQFEVNFSMPADGQPHVEIKGQTSLEKFALTDVAGAPLVEWNKLSVALRDVRPLDRLLAYGAIELDGATLHVSRDAAGRLNLSQLAGNGAPSDAPAEGTPAAPSAPAGDAVKLTVDSIAVNGLRVLWNDAAVKPAAALALDQVDFKAGPLAYPFAAGATLPVSLKATLATQATGSPALARLGVDGQVSDQTAALDLKLSELSLEAFAPYIADVVSAKLSGRLSAAGSLKWAAGGAPSVVAVAASGAASGAESAAASQPTLLLSGGEVVLDDLRVSDERKLPTLALKQFALRELEVDATARKVLLGSVKLEQPAVAVARDREGQWNVQRWMKTQAGAAQPVAASPAKDEQPWQIELRDFALDNGSVRVDDAQVNAAEPVLLVLRSMKLGVQKLVLAGSRTTSPASVQFSARLANNETAKIADKSIKAAAGALAAGAMDWRGQFGLQPLMLKGKLRLERLPVHAFEPYVRERLPVSLQRAEAGFKADVSVRELPAGLDVAVAGDALIADVLVHTRADADLAQGFDDSHDLLSWNALKFNGLKFAMAPAQPMRVNIAEIVLSDFFSRLILNEQGRLNLQDVQPADQAAAAPDAGVALSAPAAAPASAPVDAPSSPPLLLSVGRTQLVNGRIDFTDHFVRPNYSADLSELNGTLGAFSSTGGGMAVIDLKGRAARTALLEISGQFNPTAKPLAMDVRARATDLELAPLSPYSGKYAGYVIERGKLSMDLAYQITPEGQLQAKNKVVVNQLTFGDRVDSPDATSLPVRLAVSLLQDSNGVIDINLPITGSLQDPQFSVGRLILKVIGNLLTKAVTAPFSLLFGSDETDFSQVTFKPGSVLLTDAGAADLEKVAKALADKPSLKLTVTGSCDPDKEHDDYLKATLEARLQKEKARERARDGQVPAVVAGAASAPEVFGAAERERLLKAVYKQTDIPDKPRNLVGMAKDIPGPEMEALLKKVIPVSDDLMRELALQRGLAVRDGLVAKGLPSERLFVGAPKPRAAYEPFTDSVPGAELALKND